MAQTAAFTDVLIMYLTSSICFASQILGSGPRFLRCTHTGATDILFIKHIQLQ